MLREFRLKQFDTYVVIKFTPLKLEIMATEKKSTVQNEVKPESKNKTSKTDGKKSTKESQAKTESKYKSLENDNKKATTDKKKASSNNNEKGAKKSGKTDIKKGDTSSNTVKLKAGVIKPSEDAAKSLDELYEHGLKDIYWAEKALLKELPKMEKNAISEALKAGITKHIKETEVHVERLEHCFAELGKKAKGEKCDAMQGLLDEGKSIMESTEYGEVRDVGIIAAAQKVEHYEIATYGTLAAFAKVLGHKKGLKELLKTLEEEKQCDIDLTAIADTALNSKAKS